MSATPEPAEWIVLAISLGLEILSAACDQASSPRTLHYALFGVLLTIAAVLISIGELIYRGKGKGVVLRRCGMLWWFYHPPPSRHTPFGTLPDIYGLVAGISQCICSIVQFVYCLRHADSPLKASLLPAIFLICLLSSRLSNKRMNANLEQQEQLWQRPQEQEQEQLVQRRLRESPEQQLRQWRERQWRERQQQEWERQRLEQQLRQWRERQQQEWERQRPQRERERLEQLPLPIQLHLQWQREQPERLEQQLPQRQREQLPLRIQLHLQWQREQPELQLSSSGSESRRECGSGSRSGSGTSCRLS